MTLTLADVRLAALRVVVGATPLALLLLVLGKGTAPGRTVAAAVAFAAWGIGPVTLVERVAGRRELGPLRVALAAGAASALFLPAALLPAFVLGKGAGGEWVASAVSADELLPCLLLGLLASPLVAGATFVHVVPAAGRAAPSPLARWLLEPLLAGAALVGGIPLLAVYAIADLAEHLLVGQGPAMERRLETLSRPDEPTKPGDA